MAVKVAHDMNVFPVLAKSTSPVSVEELAAAKPANPLLVGKTCSFRSKAFSGPSTH